MMQSGKKKQGASKESLSNSLSLSSRWDSLQKLTKRNLFGGSPRQNFRGSRSDLFGRRRQRRSLSDLDTLSLDFVDLEPNFSRNYRFCYGLLVDAVLNKYVLKQCLKKISYKPPSSEVEILHIKEIFKQKLEMERLKERDRIATLKRSHWFNNVTPTSASTLSLPKMCSTGTGSARAPRILIDRPRSTESGRLPGINRATRKNIRAELQHDFLTTSHKTFF